MKVAHIEPVFRRRFPKIVAAFALLPAAALLAAEKSAQQSPSQILVQNITTMLQSGQDIAPLPDIPNGANNATITDASWYAWQEFVALSWANIPVTGAENTRETPDITKKFGQDASGYAPNGTLVAYPALVWEAFRHKAEIFSGTGNPNGYVNSQSQDYGFDAQPYYIYGNGVSSGYGYNGSTTPAPFVNADENSQIGTCQMFSGTPPGDKSPGTGTVPQNLVLFLAKGNRTQYDYIASRGWFNGGQSQGVSEPNTSGYVVINQTLPAASPVFPGSQPEPYVSFPSGVIELKSAWRLLTPAEATQLGQTQDVPGYHWATIRYYPTAAAGGKPGVADPTKWVDAPAVLIGLHIIHKTPSAPYFIYATFEQEDNIQAANGQPAEDADGLLTRNAYSKTQPTNPPSGYILQGDRGYALNGLYLKDPTTSNVFTQFATSTNPTGEIFIPAEATASTGLGQSNGNQSSYYINTQASGLPADQSSNPIIDVNRRRFLIPQAVTTVNQKAHALIKKYGYNPKGGTNEWSHYRLTNVQWLPVNKPTPGEAYSTPVNGVPPASYYQSNSMIETNIVLSGFSGQFGTSNSITDFYYQNTTYTDPGSTPSSVTKNAGQPFYNIYNGGTASNMGGCMGCHGNAAVNGGDFSFIFRGGGVANPDTSAQIPYTDSEAQKALATKFHKLFKN